MNLHILGEDPSHSPKGRCIDCLEFIEDEYNPKDCHCKAKPKYVTQNALRNLACKDFKPKQPKRYEDMTFAERNRELEKLVKLLEENLSIQNDLVEQYKTKLIEFEEHINNQKILYKEYKELLQKEEEE